MEKVTTERVGKTVMLWVGLDAHKRTTQVAAFVGDASQPLLTLTVETTAQAMLKLARRLRRLTEGEIRCCYEAGPLGLTVKRWLEESDQGIVCEVVAPSLIPVKPGERVKTDRRDAIKLARLLRSGELTEVHAPSEAEEAVRDLCRCREDANQDLLRARHRLSKFLLRRGYRWTVGRCAWTQAHRRWLEALTFELEADRQVFKEYLETVRVREEQVRRLDRAVEGAASKEPYATRVGWLRCFRGLDTVAALTTAAEVPGPGRFLTARPMMSYTGLTPTVRASGDRTRRGRIRGGNAHLRRVLVEAAWCQRHRPGISRALRRRREGQPEWVIALADRAMRRLHEKYWRMVHQGKPLGKVTVAVARELTGFLWAVMQGPRSAMRAEA